MHLIIVVIMNFCHILLKNHICPLFYGTRAFLNDEGQRKLHQTDQTSDISSLGGGGGQPWGDSCVCTIMPHRHITWICRRAVNIWGSKWNSWTTSRKGILHKNTVCPPPTKTEPSLLQKTPKRKLSFFPGFPLLLNIFSLYLNRTIYLTFSSQS